MVRTLLVVLAVLVLLAAGFAGVALANKSVKSDDAAIMVSPQTIVTAKVDDVTVHSNIPAAAVVAESLALNGAAPLAVWADDCGHVAARFAVADLALAPGTAVLELTGAYADPAAGTFAAADTVRVK